MFGSLGSSKTSVKSGIDNEESRKKRQEISVQIRKTKREDNLRKRRMCGLTGDDATTEQAQPPSLVVANDITPVLDNLTLIREAIYSNDLSRQIIGTRAIRKLLSTRSNPPVKEIIDAEFLPILCEFLGRNDSFDLQFEASWALTNIGSSDFTATLVEVGAIPKLVPLLIAEDAQLREQAAWCLGNIAGDSVKFRDMIIYTPEALNGFLRNIVYPANQSILRNVTWAISNLCRGHKPKPSFEAMESVIPVLRSMMETCTDEETLVDACWALSYVSDGDNASIGLVAKSGISAILVKILLENQDALYAAPALRTLGNIVTGSDTDTQSALDAGLLRLLPIFLASRKQKIRKEAAWIASNITAGNRNQIGAFLAMPGLPEGIVDVLKTGDWHSKKEAAWTLANLCLGGASEHIQCIVERHDAIPPLCDMLCMKDNKITSILLKAFVKILQVSPTHYADLIESAEGLDKIEALQDHADDAIYQAARDMIEQFFNGHEEFYSETNQNCENISPNVVEDQFAFSGFKKFEPTQAFDTETGFNFIF